ncbi:MAG: methyl-accepting chemotaxis protein [Acutalibacter sp.]|jgi:methyl-accepting chemotaxis protein
MLFKNVKVRRSLIGVFALMFAMTLIVTVILMAVQRTQENNFHGLLQGIVTAKELVSDTNAKINGGASTVRDIVLDPTQVDTNSETVNGILEGINSNLDSLEATGALDQSTMDSYRATVESWMSMSPQIIDQVKNGKVEDATNTLLQECSPRLKELSTTTQELLSQLQSTEESQLSALENMITVINVVVVVIIVLLAVFSIFLIVQLIHSILTPLNQLQAAVDGFAAGNLNVPVEFESRNEFGDMCESMRKGQALVYGAIDDISYLLDEMANGNFDVRSRDSSLYVGNLERVQEAVKDINFKLSDTLSQILLSADQVAAGADQVSTGAQALAQGATEQASAVEQLSATINEISQNSQKNRQNSEQAMNNSHAAGGQVQESAQAMAEMVGAMKRISDSSEEISKIIGTIENIAFQTNILALNAAVEAARAGSAGKGFAVVADEVRNLASKSDQAAKATKDFIERSVTSVEEGNAIVQRVSDTLNKTIEMAEKAIDDMESVVNAVEEETDSIAQVTEGIDQISSVVQTNSATSEESAAASEELSSQAALMKDLLAKFHLRKTDGVISSTSSGDTSGYTAAPEQTTAPAKDHEILNNFSKY